MKKKMYVDVTEVCEDCGEGGCVCVMERAALFLLLLLEVA